MRSSPFRFDGSPEFRGVDGLADARPNRAWMRRCAYPGGRKGIGSTLADNGAGRWYNSGTALGG